jgi:hypothetical protein
VHLYLNSGLDSLDDPSSLLLDRLEIERDADAQAKEQFDQGLLGSLDFPLRFLELYGM